jgi:hypothetical protein
MENKCEDSSNINDNIGSDKNEECNSKQIEDDDLNDDLSNGNNIHNQHNEININNNYDNNNKDNNIYDITNDKITDTNNNLVENHNQSDDPQSNNVVNNNVVNNNHDEYDDDIDSIPIRKLSLSEIDYLTAPPNTNITEPKSPNKDSTTHRNKSMQSVPSSPPHRATHHSVDADYGIAPVVFVPAQIPPLNRRRQEAEKAATHEINKTEVCYSNSFVYVIVYQCSEKCVPLS